MMGKLQAAAEVGRRGLQAARQAGRQASPDASVLAANAAAAMLALGRTAAAAALIDPLTTGPPRPQRQLGGPLPGFAGMFNVADVPYEGIDLLLSVGGRL